MIGRKLALEQSKWCMVPICVAKKTVIGGLGAQHRTGGYCQQTKQLSMCHQETCVFVNKNATWVEWCRENWTIVCF